MDRANIKNKSGEDMINWEKGILEYKKSLDYDLMMNYVDHFSERYSFMSITSLGQSLMGRSIPMITLGEGEKSVLYVGTHHGMEWITSVILLRFINEYCELYKSKGRMYNCTADYVFSTRTLYIIPMLNPDGVDYHINGVRENNILYDRLLRMNGGSMDFSSWQANGRGVDLNHNYNAGFVEYKKTERELGLFGGAPTRYSGTSPESEPEVGALCNFLRFNDKISAVLTLHSQGEEIYYSSMGKVCTRSLALAKAFSSMSGYALSVPEGSAAYGGLLDWCICEMDIPAFTFECGKGKNPLPIEDEFKIYTDMREVLFKAPNMI